nr:MAG TPA: hypothetical protein [Caudoviricetes sp.]
MDYFLLNHIYYFISQYDPIPPPKPSPIIYSSFQYIMR